MNTKLGFQPRMDWRSYLGPGVCSDRVSQPDSRKDDTDDAEHDAADFNVCHRGLMAFANVYTGQWRGVLAKVAEVN